MEKPDVDAIEGLSPAIAIEQKGAGSNLRSTVATITEIYDYLRLLFRAWVAPLPELHAARAAQQEMMVDQLLQQYWREAVAARAGRAKG